MNLKQLNVKQAERWLQKLKTENLQSYKDVTKFLRKYEKTEDQYDCYVKISHTLLSHSQLTKELNSYMEEGNKFVVNKPEDQKIKDFMVYVKKNRPEAFDEIIKLIQDLSNSRGDNPVDISKSLKPRLRDIIKGDLELERITQQALDLTGEELINRKGLEHLKMPKVANNQAQQPQVSRPLNQKSIESNKVNSKPTETKQNQPKYTKNILNFANVGEQKTFMQGLQDEIGNQKTYNYIIKVIKIYYLNIITRNQAFDLLANITVKDNALYMENLRDILDSRENDRRKLSVFRPLNDMNFSNCERISPSYVSVPIYYPIVCSGKTPLIRSLTNDRWVSLPYGSQEGDNFNVRNKNANEINLLKAEDQRYEFDIYMKRLQKTADLLVKLLDQKSPKTEKQRQLLISKVISMGVIQLIYKNCNKDQKQEIQWFLKVNQHESLCIFKQRVQNQISQLKGIKQIHANKNWNEVASKNFYKALDLKGFEFKKNEKEKMKGTFFISQLQQRNKILKNGGQCKNMMIAFEDKKQFFTVLNSFESSSRTERCNSRKVPPVECYDLKDQLHRHFYPLIILAFQDQSVCQHIYSLLVFYIEFAQIPESQKTRCKYFLQQFLVNFLGWSLPTKLFLNQNFDEEKLYAKISKNLEQQIDFKSWFSEQQENSIFNMVEKSEAENIKIRCVDDGASEYSYFPVKSSETQVLYGSEHLYTFSRFIYTLYQRLIKMREVSEDDNKIFLFQILFYSSIKVKEGIKFEQNLNLLFGKHAYLFSTFYKLFDNLLKSLSNVSNCAVTAHSFKYSHLSSENIYFVLLNRLCLANNLNNNKLLRLTYNKSNKVIYFNYLQSYYKTEQVGKDIAKKRQEIAKGIEIYTVDSFGLADKKRKRPHYLENNQLEYIFEGSTIKMLNHRSREDLLLHSDKRSSTKMMKRELKRSHKLVSMTS